MSDEVLGIVARVRRGTRNADILAICDGYEKAVAAARTRPVEVPIKAVDATPEKSTGLCPKCERDRVAHAAEMRRYRAKRKVQS